MSDLMSNVKLNMLPFIFISTESVVHFMQAMCMLTTYIHIKSNLIIPWNVVRYSVPFACTLTADDIVVVIVIDNSNSIQYAQPKGQTGQTSFWVNYHMVYTFYHVPDFNVRVHLKWQFDLLCFVYTIWDYCIGHQPFLCRHFIRIQYHQCKQFYELSTNTTKSIYTPNFKGIDSYFSSMIWMSSVSACRKMKLLKICSTIRTYR